MNSLSRRHFMLTAGMILLSFALLGAAFLTVSYQYTIRDRKESLQAQANYTASLSGQLLSRGMDVEDENFAYILTAAARLLDSDVFYCDMEGEILLACDGAGTLDGYAGRSIPVDVVNSVLSESTYSGMSSLEVFAAPRFVSGSPVQLQLGPVAEDYGVILVTASTEKLMMMWRALGNIFFFSTVVVLCIAFISSSVTSRQQTKPLKEVTDAVHRFGMGEYDLRVKQQTCARQDEVGELGRAFNAMADSIASAEQKRAEFVSNISHELKTPMTTIAGFADGILDGTIPPEKERVYLQTISDETRRLSRLVRRMLNLSKLQSGGDVVLSQTEFDLVETMAQVLISLEGKITGKGLDVDARMPDNAVMVWGDPDAITQVCYNLLDNAIKFARRGTAIGVTISTKGGKAYVSIRDVGETIPEAELPLIFDRFHKSDRSRSLDKEGVGLGLYLVKTILNDLKETITVTSKDERTEFIFTLTLST